MSSRPVVLGVLAMACVTAAAGGAYVAVRQGASTPAAVASLPSAAPAPQPVTETEGVVSPAVPAEVPEPASATSAGTHPEAPKPATAAARPARQTAPVAVRREAPATPAVSGRFGTRSGDDAGPGTRCWFHGPGPERSAAG